MYFMMGTSKFITKEDTMKSNHRWFTPTNVDLGEVIYIRPKGPIVEGCSYFLSYDELPQELKDAGAVEPYGVGARCYDEISHSSLSFPCFVKWKKDDKSPKGYSVYHSHQGIYIYDIDQDGKCYKRMPLRRAYLLQANKPIPEYFLSKGNVSWDGRRCTVVDDFRNPTTVEIEPGDYSYFLVDGEYRRMALLSRKETIEQDYFLCDITGHIICPLEEAFCSF